MINQLAKEFEGERNCIGDNMEKYITFAITYHISLTNQERI